MLLAFISWIWIGTAAFLCGFAVLSCLFPREAVNRRSVDLYIMAGLCVLTVYAQFFSLFYKVGGASTGILMMGCLAIIFIFRRKIQDYCREQMRRVKWYWLLIFIILAGMILVLTVQYTFHSDTDGYHAPSIRWIEEYGVVFGLGNLYHRLAYNSAFFCLQALFSMKFAVNQSLHTMNGFIAFIMLCYAVKSLSVFRKGEKIKSSDLLKLCLIFYFCIFENRWQISSPGSDISALSMVLYISAKWCELCEEGCEDIQEFGVLCLLAVWTVTLKLSAAMIVLLAIYPGIQMIRSGSWKRICLFLAAGLIIVLPFLVRNVIISGYLVYPYASVDIFDVDWKMPLSTVESDSREIRAWGRGMTDVENYDAPFSVWFPFWFQNIKTGYKAAFICNIACGVYAVIYGLSCLRQRKKLQEANLLLASVAGFVFWFLSAPLIRYGVVYMLIPLALSAGKILAGLKRAWIPEAGAVILLAAGMLLLLKTVSFYGAIPWKRPVEYSYHETDQVELDGVTIYVPQPPDDTVGYQFFPSTQNAGVIERIELRTGSLEDGFRTREEYMQAEWK